jgi:ankyrin repeat protein
MGCRASKAAEPVEAGLDNPTATSSPPPINKIKSVNSSANKKTKFSTNRDSPKDMAKKGEKLYKFLVLAQSSPADSSILSNQVLGAITPAASAYQNPNTNSTPLHMAVRLLDSDKTSHRGLFDVMLALLSTHPDALVVKDASGNIPLHYAVAPSSQFSDSLPAKTWATRASIVRLLLRADTSGTCQQYLRRNNVMFQSGDGGCTALYRALQMIPDDFDFEGHTVTFVETLVQYTDTVGVGNSSDGDKPLALLYRRFTRQFDLAEKFFSGDNSRPEVVEHRRRYKTSAGNTWKIIEALLRSRNDDDEFRTVHRAVQVQTPPDLFRYIVETNSEELTIPDESGKLPLHYAAMSKKPDVDTKVSFPAFYSKYVIDELLYKYPEAAAKRDGDGFYPLALAAAAGKPMIGGGIKSLYDAYPEAVEQIDLQAHETLREALSVESGLQQGGTPKEEKVSDGIVRDEQHDAIMLVQTPNVDVSEVVTSMWAHEEDAGVQMLGCVALTRMVTGCQAPSDILRIALSAVPAVVNSMKAHPNQVIVQEKACYALKGMAWSDGRREVSFVASGAVASIVGAMQAHVSDAGVQEGACGAIAEIIRFGGDDRATIVASVSGLTAIVNALAAHPDVVGVQRAGCDALRELTEFTNANLPELPKSQADPLLMAARDKFPQECGPSVEILLRRTSSQ